MEFFRIATKSRIRLLQTRFIWSWRSVIASTSIRLYYWSPHCLAASERKDERQKTDVVKQQKSILEEVLIREHQKPKTTAQKGNVVDWFCIVPFWFAGGS